MSVRPRISVLRLRQLSIRRLYGRRQQRRNLDLAVLGQERREPPPRVRELAPRALGLAVPEPPAGRGEVAQAGHELVLAESGSLVQSSRRLPVLAAEEVALGAPEDALEARFRRGPIVRIRVVVHGHERA